MRYRAEVDGLRAVAVLPVILFHAGFPLWQGGYVGVDIFFVLSGYLITTILMADLDRGRFSILTFYERRARRILPALLFVMAVCVPFAWAWMLPAAFENFGQSVVATLLFSNNILLTLTAGYWDLDSEFKPLLHTWSLGVEEQFYIFFPLMLMAVWRFGARLVTGLMVLLAAASLALAQVMVTSAPDAAFYLLPTRAWELLAGALVAVWLRREGALDRLDPRAAQGLSLAGLAMIGVSIFAYDKYTPFPGIYAVLPVLGTALVLVSARAGTLVHRMLVLRPVVFVGLISYSAYLWHQPLFAFARIYARDEVTPLAFGALSVLTLGLAWATWRFVEQPFRVKGSAPPRVSVRALVLSTGGVTALLLAAGLAMHLRAGFPERLYPVAEAASPDFHIGYNERNYAYRVPDFADDGRVRLLVLGDSFARDAINMLRETLDMRGVDIVYRQEFFTCLEASPHQGLAPLVAGADVVLLTSGRSVPECAAQDIAWLGAADVFYLGPKNFGANLNWLMRVPAAERVEARNHILPATLDEEAQ